ncbi:hypothetical protein DFH07DRAFT_775581 [Mycena maculata]|uniref:Uncharacterized protein n=1 Tax=Mycena maculata TaxID=230809 RepID=A0AAD7ITW4_9AGAR|nr:hypothetical protein DFH07DRAFT_775581 [Mycena maculata]
MTFISYPPEKMGDGLGHVVVGAMPTAKDSVLKMLAEMQHVDCESRINRVAVNSTNFAADGQVIMDICAHVIFMAQMFLLLIVFLSNQLPLSYDFRIDSDQFLSAFSFSVDGQRESVGLWTNRPGYWCPGSSPIPSQNGSDLVAQETHRSVIMKRWHLHYNRYSCHIPFAVIHEKLFEVDEDGALLHAPPTISTCFDTLGNPIEPGGWEWMKVTPPVSQATLRLCEEKKHAAKLKKLLKGLSHGGTTSSDSEDGPRSSKCLRDKGKQKAVQESEASDEELPSPAKKKKPKVVVTYGSNDRATAFPARPIVVEMSDGELDVDIGMEEPTDAVDIFLLKAGGFSEYPWLFDN